MSFDKSSDLDLSQWVYEQGPDSDIVLSSRIRLARNFEDIPYPNTASEDELIEVVNRTNNCLEDRDQVGFNYINMKELPEVERQLYVEKNLSSPSLIDGGPGKGLLLNDGENVSIMVNEEDHLRIQVLLPGLALTESWNQADNIDDFLEERLDFAFSEKWGYLSACPTNVGTGLRASVMIHLPALDITGNIERMLKAVSQLGLVVRGIYGEGSQSNGNIYQISNQITLGNSEKEIIDNLKSVTTQIIDQERQARKRLLEDREVSIRDQLQRSYGLLTHAYKISSEEAMKLLSHVRLGVDLEIISGVNTSVLKELMVLIRPAHLQKAYGRELGPEERDVKRAELIQHKLNI